MGTKRAAVLLLSLLALSGALVWASEDVAAEVEKESLTSDVLVLDVKNFTDVVEKHDFIVVEFYAPWCGHCKSLAPEYEVAATALKSHDPPIILAKVDASEEENRPLGDEFGVQGFPTLKVIRNKGEVISEYKGPREANGIISYLTKLSGPPSAELTSADQAEEFLSENEKDLVVVGVFSSLDGEEYASFLKVADAQRSNYIFAHTTDVTFVPDNGVPLKAPSIRIYKNFDDKFADFTDFAPEAVVKFVEAESVPLVTEMSQKPEHRPALMKFFQSNLDKVFLLLAGSQTEDAPAALLASFSKDAKTFKEKNLIFLFCEQGEGAKAVEFFGLTVADLPAYIVQDGKAKKYIARNVNAEQLAPWLEDYLGGGLKEHIKSEPIPEVNDEPVKVVVADSIKEVVLDSGKDVFLEFYAPWCGHCKNLAPILEEVAVSFESDPDILVAKFDASSNDVPSDLFEVSGFPTLYFYSASGVVTPFDGARTKEGMIEFINEHRSLSGNLGEAVEETASIKDEL